jgi:hypothetical protein
LVCLYIINQDHHLCISSTEKGGCCGVTFLPLLVAVRKCLLE